MNRDVARMKRRLQKAVNDLDNLVDQLVAALEVPAGQPYDPTYVQTLAELWRVLDHTRDPGITQQMAGIRDRVGRILNPLIRHDQNRTHIFPKVGALKADWSGGGDQWDGVRLARAVAARAADQAHINPLTGEIGDPLPPGALALYVANEIIACAGLDAKSKSWRVGDLEARGFDPKEYREPGADKRPTVRWA